MKKLISKCTLTLLMVFGLVACRKDQLQNLTSPHQDEIVSLTKYMLSDEIHKQYFFPGEGLEGRSPDPLLDSIKYEIARQDQVFHFVKDHSNKYGSPLWNDRNVYTFGSDKIKVYFIPYIRNKKIEAMLAAYIDVVLDSKYYFELLDRKNVDELIKKSNASTFVKNILPFVGEYFIQGDFFFKENNKTYYDWYFKESKRVHGLTELETRGFVTICQAIPCPITLNTLEERGCEICQSFWAYTSSGYVGGGGGTWSDPNSGCWYCGTGNTGTTGTGGGTGGGGTVNSGSTSTVQYIPGPSTPYSDPSYISGLSNVSDDPVTDLGITIGTTEYIDPIIPRRVGGSPNRGNTEDLTHGSNADLSFVSPPELKNYDDYTHFKYMRDLFSWLSIGTNQSLATEFIDKFKS